MRIAIVRASVTAAILGVAGLPVWLAADRISPWLFDTVLAGTLAWVATAAFAGRLWIRPSARTCADGVLALLASPRACDRHDGLGIAVRFFRENPLSRHERMAILARLSRMDAGKDVDHG